MLLCYSSMRFLCSIWLCFTSQHMLENMHNTWIDCHSTMLIHSHVVSLLIGKIKTSIPCIIIEHCVWCDSAPDIISVLCTAKQCLRCYRNYPLLCKTSVFTVCVTSQIAVTVVQSVICRFIKTDLIGIHRLENDRDKVWIVLYWCALSSAGNKLYIIFEW